MIEIQEGKVHQLVNEFGGDYALMAEHLKIMNKRMVLLNPVSQIAGSHLFRNLRTVKPNLQLLIRRQNNKRVQQQRTKAVHR